MFVSIGLWGSQSLKDSCKMAKNKRSKVTSEIDAASSKKSSKAKTKSSKKKSHKRDKRDKPKTKTKRKNW